MPFDSMSRRTLTGHNCSIPEDILFYVYGVVRCACVVHAIYRIYEIKAVTMISNFISRSGYWQLDRPDAEQLVE